MSKSAAIFAAMAAMLWMAGCADKDPVSSQNEGADSAAGKLVISKTKAAGECNVPGCRPGFGGGGAFGPRQPAAPKSRITATLPGGVTMTFLRIPAGTFTMGSPTSESGRYDTESQQHTVTISKDFYLGKYEITQGQWRSVMGTKPWLSDGSVFSGRVQDEPSVPAVDISWNDVQAFIHQLNVAAGDSLYRLPTEAEWEYACRAGTTTAWSFGDDESKLGEYAWYGSGLTAQTVGGKLLNPWGLYDMHGNVSEWVQDLFGGGGYSSEAQTDPTASGGTSRSDHRSIRGGASFSDARDTRSALRDHESPNYLSIFIGARLVRIK